MLVGPLMPEERIAILNLNCALWPTPLGPHPGERPSQERLTSILSFCDAFDIVFFQELFSSSWNDRWMRELQQTAWYVSHSPRPRWRDKPLSTGLVILSRWPLMETKFHRLPGGGFLHWARPFALQITRTLIHQTPLWLMNTHLIAREAYLGRGGPGPIREMQLAQIQAQIPGRDRWILAGDFNSNPESAAIRAFKDGLGANVDVYWPSERTTHDQIRFAAHHPNGATRTDHIYSSLQLKDGRTHSQDCTLSDHFPISCTASFSA